MTWICTLKVSVGHQWCSTTIDDRIPPWYFTVDHQFFLCLRFARIHRGRYCLYTCAGQCRCAVVDLFVGSPSTERRIETLSQSYRSAIRTSNLLGLFVGAQRTGHWTRCSTVILLDLACRKSEHLFKSRECLGTIGDAFVSESDWGLFTGMGVRRTRYILYSVYDRRRETDAEIHSPPSRYGGYQIRHTSAECSIDFAKTGTIPLVGYRRSDRGRMEKQVFVRCSITESDRCLRTCRCPIEKFQSHC